jgi:frataxin
LSPESENPQPKVPESHAIPVGPADLTIENYNELSDTYLDSVIAKLEQFQEEMDDVDVEYSVLPLLHQIFLFLLEKQAANTTLEGWSSDSYIPPKRYLCNQ